MKDLPSFYTNLQVILLPAPYYLLRSSIRFLILIIINSPNVNHHCIIITQHLQTVASLAYPIDSASQPHHLAD